MYRPSFFVLLAGLGLLAGCATAPSPPPAPPLAAAPEPVADIPPVECPAGTPLAAPDTAPATTASGSVPRGELRPATFSSMPHWSQGVTAGTWQAFLQGCRVLGQQTAWQESCEAARHLPATADTPTLRRFFEAHFTPWQVVNRDGSNTGLVTGYYEPLLSGSRTRSNRFRYPLYAPPPDLLTIDLGDQAPDLHGRPLRGRVEGQRVVPYFTRAQIDRQTEALSGQALAWVEDPVALFFLQIQGSGRIALPDGTQLRVGYANQNGHPFRSIGHLLVERGDLTPAQVSLQGIRAWATAHPDQVGDLLAANPSYVFFRLLPDDLPGPIGTLGVPITGGASLAVDPRVIPLGAPVFIDTTEPASLHPLRRLMLAQDTGGAIHGAVRADFFWGYGAQAEAQAGTMKQAGRLWVLYPRAATPPAPR